jgi:hypothetical protein
VPWDFEGLAAQTRTNCVQTEGCLRAPQFFREIERPIAARPLMHQNIVTNAVAEILAQHDQLRTMMDRCEQLADQVDVGKASPELLIREIAELRVTLEQHLREEELLLRPLLRDVHMTNEIRIERAFADHVGEHRAMAQRFMPGPTAELRDTLASLRDHLESEERYFLHRLRPDVRAVQTIREQADSDR